MMHHLVDRVRWGTKRAKDALLAARQVVLGLGGLGAVNSAVWINSVTWGLVTTGVTLLLLQFLTEGETPGRNP